LGGDGYSVPKQSIKHILELCYDSVLMNAKKLSKKQQQQISNNQNADSENALVGLVVARYADVVEVENQQQQIYTCNLRRNLPAIVVGDQVSWQITNANQQVGIIVAVQPRQSQMLRRNQRGDEKLIAANVNQILIVAADEPARSEQVIDRYLIMTELQAIPAGIIINKIDALSDEQLVDKHELLIRYKQLGYPLLYVSATAEQGLLELQQQLKDKITVFVGLSGVGKSSLIQALLPNQDLSVGALSEQGRQGQHTTTTARLYHLADGGSIIDSPGIREFALEGLSQDEILAGFIEIQALSAHCKFRDCKHRSDPGCAVQQAVQQGHVHPLRLKAFNNARETAI
jgi:ribosome biogenesis GTPase